MLAHRLAPARQSVERFDAVRALDGPENGRLATPAIAASPARPFGGGRVAATNGGRTGH